MNTTASPHKYRLLIIDDNRAIHEDFRKILAPDTGLEQLGAIEADLFGRTIDISHRRDFEIDSAYQGEQGLERVEKALAEGRPYSLAFVDMRMPPGWNGMETIERIWQADPELQVVICSAYSDHSWAEISQRVDNSDRLLILKKPFDNVEILQMAYAMSRKCELARLKNRDDAASQANLQAVNADLLASIAEIRDNVRALQDAFAALNNQLTQFHSHTEDGHALTVQQLLAKLTANADVQRIVELEAQFPDVVDRLQLLLQRAGMDRGEGESDDKPMH